MQSTKIFCPKAHYIQTQPDLCFRFVEGPDSLSATSLGTLSSLSPSLPSSSSSKGARQPWRRDTWARILSVCTRILRPAKYCWVISEMAVLLASIVLRAPLKVLTASTKEKNQHRKKKVEGEIRDLP